MLFYGFESSINKAFKGDSWGFSSSVFQLAMQTWGSADQLQAMSVIGASGVVAGRALPSNSKNLVV